MLQFQLFRLKLIRSPQMQLPYSGKSSVEIISEAIRAKPSAALRRGHIWHIGNIADLDSAGLYFAVGRTTTATVERYDPKAGNFVEETFETAPYTHVLLDLDNQVVAIAAKPDLAPSVAGIARQIQRLLDESPSARDHEMSFELLEIKDPKDFITHLQTAYAVTRFTFMFSRPNPTDVNKDFVEPLERFLTQVHGNHGNATVAGENLDATVLEKVAKSAAATGDDAEVQIRSSASERPIRKRLKSNPVTLKEKDPDTLEKKITLLSRIRALYIDVKAGIK